MNERSIGDVIVKASKNVVRDSFARRILDIVLLLHLMFIAFIEDVCVENQDREGNEICLLC